MGFLKFILDVFFGGIIRACRTLFYSAWMAIVATKISAIGLAQASKVERSEDRKIFHDEARKKYTDGLAKQPRTEVLKILRGLKITIASILCIVILLFFMSIIGKTWLPMFACLAFLMTVIFGYGYQLWLFKVKGIYPYYIYLHALKKNPLLPFGLWSVEL